MGKVEEMKEGGKMQTPSLRAYIEYKKSRKAIIPAEQLQMLTAPDIGN